MKVQDDIVERFANLFPHEHGALLAALCRDANAQLDKAETGASHADCHAYNHRMALRLLEMLGPGDYDCRPGERCGRTAPVFTE